MSKSSVQAAKNLLNLKPHKFIVVQKHHVVGQVPMQRAIQFPSSGIFTQASHKRRFEVEEIIRRGLLAISGRHVYTVLNNLNPIY